MINAIGIRAVGKIRANITVIEGGQKVCLFL